jgi:phosphoglucosamine mutase
MSNLGLERYLAGQRPRPGAHQGRRPLCGRAHARNGYNVGGEQSGHIVCRISPPPATGWSAALQVLAEVCRRFDPVPQVLKNVRHSGGNPLNDSVVKSAIAEAEATLGSSARLVIRPSGTEPLIRVMAEGDDRQMIETVVDQLINVISGVRNAA